MRRLIPLFILLFTIGCQTTGSKNAATTQADQLFQDYWNYLMDTYPQWSSSLGDNRHPTKITDSSYEAIQKRFQDSENFLKRAEAIAADKLNAQDRVSLDLFIENMREDVEAQKFETYLMTLGPLWGFHTQFAELHNRSKLDNATDFDNYFARLKQYPIFVDNNVDLLKRGMKTGRIPPQSIFKGYDKTFMGLIVKKVENSPYYKPFKKLPESISAADQERIRKEAKALIEDVINPTNEKLLKFWQNEYYPNLRKTIAASDLPNGKEYYDFVIRKHTTLPLTAKEVHELGQREVKRIIDEMKVVIKKTGFKGNLKAFRRHLRRSPKFYAKTPDELMRLTAYHLKRMDGELPKLFHTLPRLPYGIKKVPDYMAPKQTTAYYQSGSQKAKRAGFYFVNTYDLRSRPLYEVEVLSYHEAVPGHHLQIALAQEIKGLPNFRKHSGFTAYVEGWGLYSESLGKDVGFYEDPYNDYGRLVYELWRACRLVVDTGIHSFGWSRRRAIDYMHNTAGLTKLNATSEVDRYISWPGQALAYKVGQLKILELRERAERELGDRYDIRDFHDVVLLNGAVPLKTLEKQVALYIEEKKRK